MKRPSLPTILAFVTIVCLGVLARSHELMSPHFSDFHHYRQADSAAFVHGYLVDSFNPLDPSIDRQPCPLKQHRFGRVEAELPVAAWVAAVPLKLLGMEEAPAPYLRAFAIALFVLTCVYLFAWLVALGGDAIDGLCAVLALSALPFGIFFTRSPQPDGPSLLFATACLFHLTRYGQATRTRDALWAAFWGLLLLLIKISNGYLLPVALYVLAHERGLRATLRDRRVWLMVFALALPVGAWYWHAHRQPWSFGIWGDTSDDKFTTFALFIKSAMWREMSQRVLFDLFTWAGLILGVVGFTAGAGVLRVRVAGIWLASAFAFLLVTLGGQWRHVYYQLTFMVPMAIAIGFGIRACAARGPAGWAVLAVLAVIHGATVHHVLYSKDNPKAYFKQDTALVESIDAMRKHLPRGAKFVSTSLNPAIYVNTGHRGYFVRGARLSEIRACMKDVTPWLVLDTRSRGSLSAGNSALKREFVEKWRGKMYSIWQQKPASAAPAPAGVKK
jgi:hypothetical protein